MKSLYLFNILRILCALFLLLPDSACGSEKGEPAVRQPLPAKEEIAKLPPDGGTAFNRLIHETSPYLRQHARNPVDWYPWGEEAFAKARKENKPVFLSVGYSSCHWCHVMEHESFEDDEVAQLLNEKFISIKVDREERPDVDQIYMNATQVMTQRGGWPNSVWLDHEKRPWFCGTYFPKNDRGSQPGFMSILGQLSDAWQNQPDVVAQNAAKLAEVLENLSYKQLPETPGRLDRSVVDMATASMKERFDDRYGGFGGAPKFPPHGNLEILLYAYGRNPVHELNSLPLIRQTLDAMAQGGIYDHIGGGFHRYATDEKWFLPHFEKMLYDNAQLARVYADASVILENPEYEKVARDTLDWVLRDMRDPDGGFYCAYDADSEGEEGKHYLWRHREILDVLGHDAGKFFCQVYNIQIDGNYYDEATRRRTFDNIPHLTGYVGSIVPGQEAAVRKMLLQLRSVRGKRVYPQLDDKVLTSWNGLMIGSFAHAGVVLKEPRYIEAARQAADFILTRMRKDGRLLRTYRAGEARLNGYLDDYAFFINALLDLHTATGDKKWLAEADGLMSVLLKHYWDGEHGGFYFTSDDHEDLLTRSKDPFDSAIPSGNGMAARALVRLGQALDSPTYTRVAEQSFETFKTLILRAPEAAASFVMAYALYADRHGAPAAPVSNADAQAAKKPVRAEAYVSYLEAAANQTVKGAIKIKIEKGWHINADKPGLDLLIPTAVVLADQGPFELGEITFPESKTYTVASMGESFQVYEGTAWIRFAVKIKPEARPGPAPMRLKLTFQACDDKSCLPPENLVLSLPMIIDPGAVQVNMRHFEIFQQ